MKQIHFNVTLHKWHNLIKLGYTNMKCKYFDMVEFLQMKSVYQSHF